MKKTAYILVMLGFQFSFGQDALHNFGNVKIHNMGAMGFHGDLINDGDFDENEGLAGFYNQDNALKVSGNNSPVFQDIVVAVTDDLFLEVSVGLTNVIDYLEGRVVTPRDDLDITLDFLNNSLYFGENDDRHTDGYATVTGELDFTFPIGDDFRVRPLTVIPENSNTSEYKAAYFFEDPNSPTTFVTDFNTSSYEPSLSIVSEKEFWDFNGVEDTQVTLTWDPQSIVRILASELRNLRVVGYATGSNKWIDLGNTQIIGDFNNGTITSNTFSPQDYEVVTIGSVLKGNGSIIVYDVISPNGDGLNDFLIIEGIESVPDNELLVYNRWGVQVFSKKNYDNSFGGISDGRATINKGEPLPVGTYFYVLKLPGQNNLAGSIYINR